MPSPRELAQGTTVPQAGRLGHTWPPQQQKTRVTSHKSGDLRQRGPPRKRPVSAARAASAAVGPRHLWGLWGLRQGRRATEQTGPGEDQLLIAPRAAQATLRPAWGIDQAGDPRSASQWETHPHPPPRLETHSGSTTGSSSPEATGASRTSAVSQHK